MRRVLFAVVVLITQVTLGDSERPVAVDFSNLPKSDNAIAAMRGEPKVHPEQRQRTAESKIRAEQEKIRSDTNAYEKPPQEPDSLQLTPETFHKTIPGTKAYFVKFFAPWCGHCKAMAQDWKQLALNISETPSLRSRLVIAEVDGSVWNQLALEQDVSSFPTLHYYPAKGSNNARRRTYNAARNFATMFTWVKAQNVIKRAGRVYSYDLLAWSFSNSTELKHRQEVATASAAAAAAPAVMAITRIKHQFWNRMESSFVLHEVDDIHDLTECQKKQCWDELQKPQATEKQKTQKWGGKKVERMEHARGSTTNEGQKESASVYIKLMEKALRAGEKEGTQVNGTEFFTKERDRLARIMESDTLDDDKAKEFNAKMSIAEAFVEKVKDPWMS